MCLCRMKRDDFIHRDTAVRFVLEAQRLESGFLQSPFRRGDIILRKLRDEDRRGKGRPGISCVVPGIGRGGHARLGVQGKGGED